jgi:hypothetical protein
MTGKPPGRSTARPRPTAGACIALLALGAMLAPAPGVRGADSGDIVAVSSRASADYVRTKRPDGSFPAETYTFGEGGHWRGPMQDDTIDKLGFIDVARTIAGPLAERNYVPAKDPKHVQLLIMVYWGTTAGAGDTSSSMAYQNLQASQTLITRPTPAPGQSGASQGGMGSVQSFDEAALTSALLLNHLRDWKNAQNAGMLGYDSASAMHIGYEFTALHGLRQDLINDLEEDRYFVVLMAYDFPLLLKEKKHKLVWETRFSVRANRHDFGEDLAAMAKYASRYFGEDTNGLVRKPIPEGNVKVGELKNLGVVPETRETNDRGPGPEAPK